MMADTWEDGGGAGEWSWLNHTTNVELKADNLDPEFMALLTGSGPVFNQTDQGRPLRLTVPSKDGTRHLDFIMYNVKLPPLPRPPWYKRWWRKLLRKPMYPLKVTYTGNALMSGTEPTEKIGRLV